MRQTFGKMWSNSIKHQVLKQVVLWSLQHPHCFSYAMLTKQISSNRMNVTTKKYESEHCRYTRPVVSKPLLQFVVAHCSREPKFSAPPTATKTTICGRCGWAGTLLRSSSSLIDLTTRWVSIHNEQHNAREQD